MSNLQGIVNAVIMRFGLMLGMFHGTLIQIAFQYAKQNLGYVSNRVWDLQCDHMVTFCVKYLAVHNSKNFPISIKFAKLVS